MAPTELTKSLGKRKRADSGESSSSDDEAAAVAPPKASSASKTGTTIYKQKVLLLCSRGVTFHHRHLVSDLFSLLPHSKKESKLSDKHSLPQINELCFLSSCTVAMFFESRRQNDMLYLWTALAPNGPSIRFQVLSTNTMEELRFEGNCLKGGRGIVLFGQEFESSDMWKTCKEILGRAFAVPKTSRRVKPFIDRIINFSILDGKIWFRHYQIIEESSPALKTKKSKTAATSDQAGGEVEEEKDGMRLVEIGPRFVLLPIKIFEGSFCGATVYENPEFVPPSQVAAAKRLEKADKYLKRKGKQMERTAREAEIQEMLEEERENQGFMEKRAVFA
ncbi:Brix-domain-containing protein [Atractiella rhizophila]|nr:Brix-domain-containing protein [Atractiella rhizophila]